MSKKTRVLAFAASNRDGSFNRRAVEIAAEGARSAGAEVTLLALGDYPLPLFDQDLEAGGVPEAALALRQLFAEHDALLVASPEYNGFFTPLLKNTVDWLSRPGPEGAADPFEGKVGALVSASPGRLGGIRGIPHARLLLENVGVLVIPESHSVGAAYQTLDDGAGRETEGLQEVGAKLATVAAALRSVA